jgi:hypothetical protein
MNDVFAESETKHPNADNERLGYLRAGGFAIGYVDEVNGDGAEELPLMPTRHELLVLVKYWAEVEIAYDFEDHFLMESACSSGSRRAGFASRRIERIVELLGWEVVGKAMTEAEDAYGKRQDPKAWAVFCHGTPEEQEAFHAEMHEEQRKRHEEWDNKLCTCGHRQRNHCKRGTVGCLEREPNHGDQRSEHHCAETDSCLCQEFIEAPVKRTHDDLLHLVQGADPAGAREARGRNLHLRAPAGISSPEAK